MKNYEVEVYESGLHGQYKASKKFTWILSSNTIQQVKDFAFEILAGMTFEEVYSDNTILYGFEEIRLDDGKIKLRKYQAKETLGYELAERRFTIKARVYKG